MRIGFGATTGQFVPFEALCSDVCFVEGLGFDNAWVVDDFEVQGVPELDMREAWTTLAGLDRAHRKSPGVLIEVPHL